MSFKKFLFSKLFAKHLGLAMALFVASILFLIIWLNLYTRHGQARSIPNFYGLTLEQTNKLAKKSRLKFQIVDSVYTTAVPKGCIAEQNPKPGFKVKKWRNVMLIINAFSPEMIAVPNLIDLPVRQASAQIVSAGFTMGEPKYKSDISFGTVLEQLYNGKKINPGDSLQKGSVINLVLGKGLSNQRTKVPDLMWMNLEPARNKILLSSLSLGIYVYDKSILTAEDSARAFVYKQNPEYRDDATIQLGSAIYLWLTADSAKIPVDSTLIVLPDSIPKVDTLKVESN